MTYYAIWLAEHGYEPQPTGNCELENGTEAAEQAARDIEEWAEMRLINYEQ